MSPTKRPFQPTFCAFVANRSTKRMSCGLPQLRLRDGRMTCQVGPVIGSDTAPARQPSKTPPIERGGPGNGVDLRANSSLAGVERRVRIFQRRQRLGIERAGKHRLNQVLFLRDGGARGGKEEDGEEANDSTHQQLYSVWVCRKLESNCNHAQLQNWKNQS